MRTSFLSRKFKLCDFVELRLPPHTRVISNKAAEISILIITEVRTTANKLMNGIGQCFM